MKIGIVAMAPGRLPDFSTCDEYYGLAWDGQMRDFCTHLFEPHNHDWWQKGRDYITEVNETELPVYVDQMGRFENELKYPFGEIETDYFESTFAYMLALAISKNPEEINIWGVRMAADEEYVYQRANCEYLVGYARGKGIKVTIHNSTICKYSQHFKHYPLRYGNYLANSKES